MKERFITTKEALRRYGVSELRTLKVWAQRGRILYQVLNPEGKRPVYMFESPEARYERLMGTI